MRAFLLAILLFSWAAGAVAERNHLQATDFEPLTELPWTPGATLEGVLDVIYREPNTEIRYRVLAEYLRSIVPERLLGRSFDICVGLEGTQTPNELVDFFLDIWAERDPVACWKKTRELFRLVGIEDGWLGYDRWHENDWRGYDLPQMTVPDRRAIEASRYWLQSWSLMSFPPAVMRSSVAPDERVRILKAFTAAWWQSSIRSWPGYERPTGQKSAVPGYSRDELIEMFSRPPTFDWNGLGIDPGSNPGMQVAIEMGLRRWLKAEPGSALAIIKKAHETKWPSSEGGAEPITAGPSVELLMIWARADLPAMIRWAESLDIRKDDLAETARGFLMSRADGATRQRWLAEARAASEKDNYLFGLLKDWARWDTKSALEFAADTREAELVEAAIRGACFGPWESRASNTAHYRIEAVKNFDFFSLPEEVRKEIPPHVWSQYVMEVWGEIDIGETARYGLDFLLRSHFAPREKLLEFFRGQDVYPDEEGMIDRTFCALRVWAAVKPGEMKAWVATQKDADLRQALTWLLEHTCSGETKQAKVKHR